MKTKLNVLFIICVSILHGCAYLNSRNVKNNIYSQKTISLDFDLEEGQSFCVVNFEYPEDRSPVFIIKARNTESFVFDEIEKTGFVKKPNNDNCDFVAVSQLFEGTIENHHSAQETLTPIPYYTANNFNGIITGPSATETYHFSGNSPQLNYIYNYEKQGEYTTSDKAIGVWVYFYKVNKSEKKTELVSEFFGSKLLEYQDFNKDAKELVDYIFSKDIKPLIKKKRSSESILGFADKSVKVNKLPLDPISKSILESSYNPSAEEVVSEKSSSLSKDAEWKRVSELYNRAFEIYHKEIDGLMSEIAKNGYKFNDNEKIEFTDRVSGAITTCIKNGSYKLESDEEFVKLIRDVGKNISGEMIKQHKN